MGTPARPEQGSFDLGFDAPDDLSDPAPLSSPDASVAAASASTAAIAPPDEGVLVVRVRPDEPAIDKVFDYSVPSAMVEQVRIGTMVRVALHGRRVGGWVVSDGVAPPPGVTVMPLAKVTGWGPPPELFELAEWAAFRWCGRAASLLRTASPERVVRAIPRASVSNTPVPVPVTTDEVQALTAEALAAGTATVRLPPTADPYPVLLAAAALGPILVVGPVASTVRRLAGRLRRAGVPVALLPDEWASARAGAACVLGTRAATWAPIARPAAIVVLDEHDESLQQEQAPTWHARDVLVERARRLGVPCVLVSPMPSLEAAALGPVLIPSRAAERAGWPVVDVIDRRDAVPGEGLFSPRLVDALRTDGPVVCILNRKGRSRLMGCANCGEIATCERCAGSVVMGDDGMVTCTQCEAVRPSICLACGATRMKNLRAGVTRVREELEALMREPVAELTAESERSAGGTGTRIVIGTEAALHHIDRAAVVAFLDLDQELLAPRYRASEESLALLVRAARIVGPRRDGGRIVVQTRLPEHVVIQAALHADPGRLATFDASRREMLGYPPFRALAAVSGAVAPAFIESLGTPAGVEVVGPADGRWLLRATDHDTLCSALASVRRPPGRLRIEVDPLRL